MFTRYSIFDVDQEATAYLIDVEKKSANRSDGLFLPQTNLTLPLRLLQFLLLFGGLFLLAACGNEILRRPIWEDPQVEGQRIAVGMGIGLAALGIGFVAIRRPIRKSPLGSFWWIDGRYFWRSEGTSLYVLSLSDLKSVQCVIKNDNGAFVNAKLNMETSHGTDSLYIFSQADAEKVTHFLSVLTSLRSLEDTDGNVQQLGPDELLGPIANKVVNNKRSNTTLGDILNDIEMGATIPERILAPRSQKNTIPENLERRPNYYLPILAVSAALACAGWFLLPSVLKQQKELNLYKETIAIENGPAYARFLAAYPNGKFSEDVNERYEKILFDYCSEAQDCNTAPFQEYLRIFPTERRSEEISSAYEERLFNCALQAKVGDSEPYEAYLRFKPEGARSQEILDKYEENLYSGAIADGEEYELRCERYLNRFPDGKHAQEIRDLLDDRFYARCLETSNQTKSPLALRQYLLHELHKRHQEEAMTQVTAMYDHAISGLRQRFDTQQAQINLSDQQKSEASDAEKSENLDQPESNEQAPASDQEFFDAMVLLLEILRLSDTPNVAVSFTSSESIVPEGDEALREEEIIQQYLTEFPQLKDIGIAKGSPLIDIGEAFSELQKQRREKLITDRVENAIKRVIGPGFVSFVSIDEKPAAFLNITYLVHPSGAVYIVQNRLTGSYNNIPLGDSTNYEGLLRGYDLTWKFEVQSKEKDKSKSFGFESSPASEMSYDKRPGDPAWAAYAILLHSGFYDMSNRLIGGFGIPPSPLPRGHRFAEATGIETYSVKHLAAAIEHLLSEEEVLKLVSPEDQAELRTLIQGSLNKQLLPQVLSDMQDGNQGSASEPSDTKRKLEEILDKYPAINAVAMQLIQQLLDEENKRADALNSLPLGP